MIISDTLELHKLAVADIAAGGAIGTAATTVDLYSHFNVNQTTAGQILSLPNPTAAVNNYSASVVNVGSAAFTMHSVIVEAGSFEPFVWNGAAWVSVKQAVGVQKFRVVQALAAGNNVVVHSLGLLTPFAAEVEVRDNTTGAIISARVTVETTNSITLNVGAAVTAARITVLG